MLASPSQTHPTGNTADQDDPAPPSAASSAPNTLLGRQYQLTKRVANPDPVMLLMPMLDDALNSANTPTNKHSWAKRPDPQQEPRAAAEPAIPPQAKSLETTTTTTTGSGEHKKITTTTEKVAPRRMLPYPQYLAKRAYANAAHYVNRDETPGAAQDRPVPPSPPKVDDTFVANRTSSNLDRVDAAQRKAEGKSNTPSMKPVKSTNTDPLSLDGLGGLSGGLPVGALGSSSAGSNPLGSSTSGLGALGLGL
ncbi:hypothetical protein EIP86_002016 [Pleurotus ostreatoroseus]|nr:hypothetical protein EIP86_002016 [Pleurotus ostreatoroseus]